jgi:hypothetical protein
MQPFQHMAPGRKFHVTVAELTHMDFGDHHFDGFAPPEKYHELMKRLGLAFWETTLRRNDPTEAGFRRSLRQEGVGGVLAAEGATGEFQSK